MLRGSMDRSLKLRATIRGITRQYDNFCNYICPLIPFEALLLSFANEVFETGFVEDGNSERDRLGVF